MSSNEATTARTTMPKPPSYAAVRKALDASHPYRWLNPEAAMRHALAAFYQACRYADHSARVGEPLTPAEWLTELTDLMTWRLKVAAADSGAIPHESAASERHYLECYTEAHWIEFLNESRTALAEETRSV